MTRGKAILAGMIGLAILAMPVSALAKDRHHGNWNNPRPQAWHDQGRHNGWFKGDQGGHGDGWFRNHRDRDDYRPGWSGRNYYQPPAWHHEPDADDYGYNGGYGNGGGYEYGGASGTPYYGASGSFAQLMVDLQNDCRTYTTLLNRHDPKGANREWQVLHRTDLRIAALNGSAPGCNNGYYGNNGLLGGLFGNSGYYGNYGPYGNGGYYGNVPTNGYYGNPGYYGNNGYYGNSPMMGALGSLVGPLLGMTP